MTAEQRILATTPPHRWIVNHDRPEQLALYWHDLLVAKVAPCECGWGWLVMLGTFSGGWERNTREAMAAIWTDLRTRDEAELFEALNAYLRKGYTP